MHHKYGDHLAIGMARAASSAFAFKCTEVACVEESEPQSSIVNQSLWFAGL